MSAERWLEAALTLDRWLVERGDRGHDPHDLLASPFVRALTFGNRWLGVAWTQLGRRSPVSPRRLLGVPQLENSKGLALALGAQVEFYQIGREEEAIERARSLIERLYRGRVEWGDGIGWGYPFPWANRDFQAPAGTPSSVVTAFVGHALLAAAQTFGWDEARGLACSGAEFIRRALRRIKGEAGTFAFSYTPLDERVVHNANLLAASLLARVGWEVGDEEMIEEALRAARFTARAQRGDGSWPYGISARDRWIDSFHTGYTLIALSQIGSAAGLSEFDAAIEGGLDYWRESFLVGPGVSFYPGQPYPIDLHAVAHAIITLVHFRAELPGALDEAARLADWSLSEMRGGDGSFYYRRHRFWKNRVRYLRWVQGWVLLALATLVGVAGETTDS